ncbi:hypothetical protein [Streptomyces millisiae]|uniref:Uncharacterized protein n=1 Tax=Streptomyces millisiae TaxID=3075542 RepID=A0ABU2LZY1_9ACTN|nr:hypothetical protein [Streptomyces sp. DSM 44918]MDT0323154.1 hypothetical protein [Streptomyces sp. DSM 44918]
MSHMDAISVLTLLLGLRVFGPDVLTLFRWLLGAGVRVGVAAMAERHHRHPSPPASPTAVSLRGEDGDQE